MILKFGTWASICFKSLLENQLLEPPKLRWTVQMMLCVIFTFPSSSIFRCRIFRFQRIIHPTSNIHSLQRIQSYQSLIRSSCRRVGGLGPCLSRLRCPSRENIPAQLSMSGCQKTSRCTSLAARPPPPLPQSAKTPQRIPNILDRVSFFDLNDLNVVQQKVPTWVQQSFNIWPAVCVNPLEDMIIRQNATCIWSLKRTNDGT